MNDNNTYFSDLICPNCHNSLVINQNKFQCNLCKKEYQIINNIPNFCQKKEYWCNVSKEKMDKLILESKKTNDWSRSAKEIIPEYYKHIEPFDRADSQFLWPIDSKSRILDAGSMWGGLTIPIAQYCKDIFAVDKTIETLEFLKIRASQMGFKNIHIMSSTLRNLPFPDNYFDMVILNGVLEWVAFDQELILEKHWGKKRNDSVVYTKKPRQMQIDVLREINRVLKPDGHLHLGIENRFGYQYFAGCPDDHVNIRFICFLPRFIANMIAKWKLNCEYRTYIYTHQGIKSMLHDSSFQDIKIYGAFPHYINPSLIIPFDLIKNFKNEVFEGTNPIWKIIRKIFPKDLIKFFSPSFIIISKNKSNIQTKQIDSRIIQLFKKANLIQNSDIQYIEIVKLKGRSGNYHSVNYMVYNKNKPEKKYFCKICRYAKHSDILLSESNNLKLAMQLFKNTVIKSNIPKFIFFDTIDGITFLVTDFISGSDIVFNPTDKITKKDLKVLDRSIQKSINFISEFQILSQTNKVDIIPHLLSIIKNQKEKLRKEKRLTQKIDSLISKLTDDIKSIKNSSIPICAVHGDYDFYHNIVFDKDNIKVIDFEHFEKEGLPFLDLATLILNPLIMSYKTSKEKSFLSFINIHSLNTYINKWINFYANLYPMKKEILQFLIPIAALEQQTKKYSYYRKPETFPMYENDIFIELLSFRSL